MHGKYRDPRNGLAWTITLQLDVPVRGFRLGAVYVGMIIGLCGRLVARVFSPAVCRDRCSGIDGGVEYVPD